MAELREVSSQILVILVSSAIVSSHISVVQARRNRVELPRSEAYQRLRPGCQSGHPDMMINSIWVLVKLP